MYDKAPSRGIQSRLGGRPWFGGITVARESRGSSRERVLALRVNQWLSTWDDVSFSPRARRRRPKPYFYVLSLNAEKLRALSGIYRRTTRGGRLRSRDTGIQRAHESRRSEQIAEYVKYGFPWSDLPERQRDTERYANLKKPGWLPTAIVINILTEADRRNGKEVDSSDLITVVDKDGTAELALPSRLGSTSYLPRSIPPIEVIDGQHRLWAFEEGGLEEEFELPVVAFHGLDISWQAYLFWTINIKPKRINASLAFDMYPLLRNEDWLQRFEGPNVYRQARAQELTESLWSYSASPWHQRINMLGERGKKMVTQASWVRSLTSTFIKTSEGPGVRIGGLYGAPIGEDELVLPWNRAQQAAVLIFLWQELQKAVAARKTGWPTPLRREGTGKDPAFFGEHSLLNTDQGVRVVLHIANDLLWLSQEDFGLDEWELDADAAATDEAALKSALTSLRRREFADFVSDMAGAMAAFDWRSASAPDLSEDERTLRLAFRGSGGYRELRRQVLTMMAKGRGTVSEAAAEALETLGLGDR